MELKDRLRKIRKERNLKQGEVSKALGVTLSAYSNYEQGIREPSLEILVNLCKLYEVSADYLLGLEDY